MDALTIPANCAVFDTETTGFSFDEGDRLVEIGVVRMRDGLPTNDTFHRYINPQRNMPKSAEEVHGLTAEFLADKPLFDEVADDLVDFLGEDYLVAHNAGFDAGFINFELKRIGMPTYGADRFIDTIPIARKKFPGQMVNLDTLCRKLKISLDTRDKHGALVDAVLLAEVCVELMGGRQATLFNDLGQETQSEVEVLDHSGVKTRILRATPEEITRHAALVEELGASALWHKYMEALA